MSVQCGDDRWSAGNDIQPFLRSRASVPDTAQLWRSPYPHCAVDSHRCGCVPAPPDGEGVGIHAVTFGRVQDYQIRDINNMGAAMAPAAASTLLHYLNDTGTEPKDFDAIYTGDLGQVGSGLFRELMTVGVVMKNHQDCGCLLYDASEQTVKSGGSGQDAVRRCSAGISCPA